MGGLLLTILSELTLCLATAFSVSLLALQASRTHRTAPHRTALPRTASHRTALTLAALTLAPSGSRRERCPACSRNLLGTF